MAQSSDTKEFGARVPREDYEEFREHFPELYGATAWFIRTSLKEFNKRLREDPDLKDQVHLSINEMLQGG